MLKTRDVRARADVASTNGAPAAWAAWAASGAGGDARAPLRAAIAASIAPDRGTPVAGGGVAEPQRAQRAATGARQGPSGPAAACVWQTALSTPRVISAAAVASLGSPR